MSLSNDNNERYYGKASAEMSVSVSTTKKQSWDAFHDDD